MEVTNYLLTWMILQARYSGTPYFREIQVGEILFHLARCIGTDNLLKHVLNMLLTWPMAKLETFWDYIFCRENKPFKLGIFSGSRTAK